MMKHIIVTLLSTLILSACMNANTTGIQRGYVTMRDTCRGQAEGQLAYAQATKKSAGQDVSGTLAQLFSDCMESKGWAVASTKGRPGKAPPLDSIYDLPQTPGGRGPAASVAAAERQTAIQTQPQAIPQPGYAVQGYPQQQQTIQPDYRGLSPQQQQALYQQYLQQQQAYENYIRQQQQYQQQYQQFYSQQPQRVPQPQQPQQPQPQYYQAPQGQPQYYQQPQGQPQYSPQSYYQEPAVEPIQHSATSLHLSRGGRSK